MPEMCTITISMSILQREDFAQFAHDHEISVSKLLRQLMAAHTGYDLAAEMGSRVERRGRPAKYTPEERQEIARQRTRERDALRSRLMQDHKSQQHAKSVEILQKSLERRGMNF